MRPSSTTSVSTPSTGRSPASSATERAFSPAWVRTSSTASTPCTGCSSYRGATTSNGIPSCSRIAIRRGDVDASRSGAAGGASATLARHPDFLGRPLSAPLRRNVRVIRVSLCVCRRLELDQALEFEAVLAQQVDQRAMREVELDAAALLDRPFEPVHAELRTLQLLLHNTNVRRAEHGERRVTEENELPARSQQPRGLRNPLVRIGPDRRAVLRMHEVERGV